MTRRPDPDFDRKCSVLYQMELSTYEIATRLHTSQGRVAQALRRTGTPRSTLSKALHLYHGTVRLPG